MSVIKSLVNISLADQRDIFLLCNYEPTKTLRVYLINVNNCLAFSGRATDVDLRSQAAKLKMDFSDFISLTAKALTKKETDECKFLYNLQENCENSIFTWKSIDSEETIITIGSMKVSKTDYASLIKEVFSMLSTELSDLSTKVTLMEKELQNANSEKEKALKLVSDTANMKKQMEEELFSKFMLVLNEKKRKIRDLSCDNNSSSTQSKKAVKKNKKTPTIRVHAVCESSDDAVSDNEKINVAGPSNSKRKDSFLFFDEDDPSELPSPSKKRNRHQKTIAQTDQFEESKPKEKISRTVTVMSDSDEDLFPLL